jgi:hypothetical protein
MAFPLSRKPALVEAGTQLYASVQEVQELPDGYRFRLPTNSALLLTLADYLANERLSCAFLHFTVEIEPEGGPFWLCLTGREGVKEYIRSVFETTDLLNEQAAKAAGLRSPGD